MALLPENLHEEFVAAVLGSMPRPLTLEYVRLNISARKPRGLEMATRTSSSCPGDGIGPEIVGARARCSTRLAIGTTTSA